jgi:hypothetical protein
VTAPKRSWRRHWPICRCWGQMAEPLSGAFEPLAIVTDYPQLIAVLRRRVVELGTSLRAVDELAGLPDHYVQTLLALGGRRSLGRTSMGPILGALGLKLAVLPDDEALARIRHRLPPRAPCGPQLHDAEGWIGA